MIVASGTTAGVALFLARRARRIDQSEESYRSLVELSPDAIWVHCGGKIVFANSATATIFGASSPADLLGKEMLGLVHPDDRVGIRENLAKREGDLSAPLLRTERKYIGFDGRDVEVESLVRPLVYRGRPSTLVVFRDISERKQAEQKLRQSETRFYQAFNLNPEPIIINTLSEGRYIDVNDSFLRVTGYRREEIIGQTALETKLWERPTDRARYLQILTGTGSVRDLEIVFRTKAGAQRTGLISSEFVDIAGERCAIAVIRDVTERSMLEKQLRQAQKMEAVGQLTGGIAHDFNNLLGVIIGYSDILEAELDPTSKWHRNAAQIHKAAQSAAALTRQLLAFSRQQVLEPTVLDLNTIVTDTGKMLRRLLGENIELKVVLGPALGCVRADRGQIEQVIINLAVNARDAMPQGGTLTLETSSVEADRYYASQNPPMSPGSFVSFAVTDTGIGMDAETQARIFEPFFTTKERGKGTGLGLATVYGVVKQSGGFIWVQSEPGQGSTFKILLPRVDESVRTVVPDTGSSESWRGSETVLLVEDEEPLRKLILNMLSRNGYSALEAANATEAMDIADKHGEKIDLLLTDVVMPGMSGTDLAARLVLRCPELRVLYMSGYAEFAASQDKLLEHGHPLLQKPFTEESLKRKVREVLKNGRAPKLTSRLRT
jgi:two-component system, cell cycle sensor histidine kinase and response regulator CckA